METITLSRIKCRFCLDEQNLCDIYKIRNKKFAVPYPVMIKECLSIDVSQDDGLPPWMCIKCSNKINSFYRFKLKCIKSVTYLSKDVEEKKEIIIKIENECNEPISKKQPSIVYESPMYDEAAVYELPIDEEFTSKEPMDEEFISKEPMNEESNSKEPMDESKSLAILDNINKEDITLVNSQTYYDVDEAGLTIDIKIEKEIEDFVLSINPNKNNLEEDDLKDETEEADEAVLKEFQMFLPQLKHGQKECPLCVKVFSRNWLLMDHIKFKHFKIRYYCDICQQYFNSEIRHKRSHIKRKWTNCNECGMNFASQSNYLEHIRKIHKWNGPYQCDCGETFENKVLYKRHMFSVHRHKTYMCHYCDRGYTRKQKLQMHIQDHVNGKVFKKALPVPVSEPKMLMSIEDIPVVGARSRVCPVCDRTCKSNSSLLEHINNVHLGQKYYCKICKKSYSSESRHNRYSHKPKPEWTHCNECNLTFKKMKHSKQHQLDVHGKTELNTVPRYACHCGMKFFKIQEFRNHKFRKHGQTDYVCHFCSKGFLKHDKLKNHILNHGVVKRVACKICNKKFKSAEILRRHKLLHRPSGNYVCDHCGKTFTLKTYLRSHITRHDPTNKPHACKFCGKAFRRTDHRNTHERLVHKHEPTLL